MKLTTNLNEQIKLEKALIKAERLCKANKCSMIDLIVMSIDRQVEIKKAQNLLKNKGK